MKKGFSNPVKQRFECRVLKECAVLSDARLLNYMQGGCQAIRHSFMFRPIERCVCLVSRIYASKELDAGMIAEVWGPAYLCGKAGYLPAYI